MTRYNGHKNWNHWNVSLWINNDEGLYRRAQHYVLWSKGFAGFNRNGPSPRERAATRMLEVLHSEGTTHTPDGAPYSVSSIRAAMVGM